MSGIMLTKVYAAWQEKHKLYSEQVAEVDSFNAQQLSSATDHSIIIPTSIHVHIDDLHRCTSLAIDHHRKTEVNIGMLTPSIYLFSFLLRYLYFSKTGMFFFFC